MHKTHKQKIRITSGERAFDAANGLFLFLLMVVTLYPLLYVLFASMSDPSRLAMHQGLLLFPDGFSLEAYGAVAKNPMIGRGYWNTLVIMSTGTLLNLFMTSLGAFVLSRRNLPYKKDGQRMAAHRGRQPGRRFQRGDFWRHGAHPQLKGRRATRL